MVLWSEPLGNNAVPTASDATLDEVSCVQHALYGEKAYHSVRRFVIVHAREGHCVCV
jgi:hypothetical protein